MSTELNELRKACYTCIFKPAYEALKWFFTAIITLLLVVLATLLTALDEDSDEEEGDV